MSIYITVLWSPGVEPGEQAQELAVVVAVLELVAAAVVVVVVVVAVVVAVAAVAAAACTAEVSRPPERQCCWWRCAGGWRRRRPRPHSSPALAACSLRAEPADQFVLNLKRRGGRLQLRKSEGRRNGSPAGSGQPLAACRPPGWRRS